MKTISSAVEDYIKSKPFLISALSQGIINLTSLSRIIKSEIEESLRKEVKYGAIVMALKRLSSELEFRTTFKIVKIIKDIGDITVRSSLVDYNFKVSDTLLSNQAKWEGINIYEVISTSNEFTILVNEEQVDKAFKVIKNLKNL